MMVAYCRYAGILMKHDRCAVPCRVLRPSFHASCLSRPEGLMWVFGVPCFLPFASWRFVVCSCFGYRPAGLMSEVFQGKCLLSTSLHVLTLVQTCLTDCQWSICCSCFSLSPMARGCVMSISIGMFAASDGRNRLIAYGALGPRFLKPTHHPVYKKRGAWGPVAWHIYWLSHLFNGALSDVV